MKLSALVHRWHVKLWLVAVMVAERQLRAAYDQLVDVERDRAERSS